MPSIDSAVIPVPTITFPMLHFCSHPAIQTVTSPSTNPVRRDPLLSSPHRILLSTFLDITERAPNPASPPAANILINLLPYPPCICRTSYFQHAGIWNPSTLDQDSLHTIFCMAPPESLDEGLNGESDLRMKHLFSGVLVDRTSVTGSAYVRTMALGNRCRSCCYR